MPTNYLAIILVVLSLSGNVCFAQEDEISFPKLSVGIDYKVEALEGLFTKILIVNTEEIKKGFGQNIGISAEWRFNKIIGIKTGVRYLSRRFTYTLDNLAFDIDYGLNGFLTSYSYLSYDIHCSYLEIPVSFLLTIPLGKSSIYFSPGLSYMALMGSDSEGSLKYMNTDEYHPYNNNFRNSPENLSSTNFAIFFSGGYGYQLMDHLRINVEPMIRFQLNSDQMPYQKSAVNMISIGGGLGLYYTR